MGLRNVLEPLAEKALVAGNRISQQGLRKAIDTAGGKIPIIGSKGIKNVNAAAKKHKEYLKNLGAIKVSSERSLSEAARNLMSDSTRRTIDSIGFGKVALRVLKNNGTDYGKVEDLNLVKAASILGTKLAMIHREKRKILEGLQHLIDLKN